MNWKKPRCMDFQLKILSRMDWMNELDNDTLHMCYQKYIKVTSLVENGDSRDEHDQPDEDINMIIEAVLFASIIILRRKFKKTTSYDINLTKISSHFHMNTLFKLKSAYY